MINAPRAAKEESFPRIPDDLLKELNARFPERCAELSDDEKTIRHKAGQRSVIRFLNEKFKEQNENVLTATTLSR